jgi:tetrahydromethanopterin S-methyltransferase subunit G
MGEAMSITVEILKDIRDDIRGMREESRNGFAAVNARLDHLENRVDQTNVHLARLDERMDGLSARVDQTNTRLDNLIALSGRSWRDLERRVRKLERHAGV